MPPRRQRDSRQLGRGSCHRCWKVTRTGPHGFGWRLIQVDHTLVLTFRVPPFHALFLDLRSRSCSMHAADIRRRASYSRTHRHSQKARRASTELLTLRRRASLPNATCHVLSCRFLWQNQLTGFPWTKVHKPSPASTRCAIEG